MPTLYQNFQSGTLSADITNTATSFSSAALANLQVVASPDTMWIVLDPEATAGAPEIVKVTAHTSSATSATIVRGQQGTTARAHLTGVVWRASLTKSDVELVRRRDNRTSQNFPNGAVTQTMTAAVTNLENTGGVTNTSGDYVVPSDGTYALTFSITGDAFPSTAHLLIAGTGVLPHRGPGTGNTTQSLTAVMRLTTSATIQFSISNNSGGGLNETPTIEIVKLTPS